MSNSIFGNEEAYHDANSYHGIRVGRRNCEKEPKAESVEETLAIGTDLGM